MRINTNPDGIINDLIKAKGLVEQVTGKKLDELIYNPECENIKRYLVNKGYSNVDKMFPPLITPKKFYEVLSIIFTTAKNSDNQVQNE